RIFDVDDIMNNTVGALLGWVVASAVLALRQARRVATPHVPVPRRPITDRAEARGGGPAPSSPPAEKCPRLRGAAKCPRPGGALHGHHGPGRAATRVEQPKGTERHPPSRKLVTSC